MENGFERCANCVTRERQATALLHDRPACANREWLPLAAALVRLINIDACVCPPAQQLAAIVRSIRMILGHARRSIPLFDAAITNPRSNKLILLTKSANTHYLEGLPTRKVAVTFSLNPEREADLWEGKFPDTGERITPPIAKRLQACKQAQGFGFEVRWRLDPILTPPGWELDYAEFFKEAIMMGVTPSYITLGTYREKNHSLDHFRRAWGLPAPEWEPGELVADGTHWHLSRERRIEIYKKIMLFIRKAPWKVPPRVELCKEPHEMRRAVGILGCNCNCLQ